MNIQLITLLEKAADKALSFISDPIQKTQAQLEILKLRDSAEARELDAATIRAGQQVAVNLEETKSDDKFKSRGRPFIIWVCGFGLAYQFLIRPIMSWIVQIIAWWMDKDLAAFPVLDSLDLGTLMTLLFGLLGLGYMRTEEKKAGVA